jgi:anti-anti-sigma factor
LKRAARPWAEEDRMADESQLRLSERDGVTVVAFGSPTVLDAYHVNQVGKELLELVEKKGARRLALDLADIKMLSSATLRVFLTLRQKLADLGGRVVISGIDPRLYRVFRITNLQSIFDFYDDLEQAVASFAPEKKCEKFER